MTETDVRKVFDGFTARLDGLTKRADSTDRESEVRWRLLEEVARKLGVLPEVQRDAPVGVRDVAVPCPKCGTLAGYYDEATDIVRTRRGDHVVRMRLGAGGAIWISCRHCADEVLITYRAPADLGTVEVVSGVVVLDVARLAELLQAAMSDRAQTVALRLVDGSPFGP